MAKILIIEDEENLRLAITRGLEKAGHDVQATGDAGPALELLAHAPVDAVISDVSLPGELSGLDVLKQVRRDGFEGAAIVITAYASIEKAVEAMREGADDYIQKPIRLDELTLALDRCLEHRRVRRRLQLMERLEGVADESCEMVGSSSAWTDVLQLAERLSALPLPNGAKAGPGNAVPTILLLGQTGTGKGTLARYIHDKASAGADCADAPFVHVNCSALPASLIESELFGHEKGAFTDAKCARSGLFELAEGGTVFLDEIGDMPLELQSRLLLVVEQGVYRRIGGASERRVRARVITATNQDLDARVAAGHFRQDLLYRLNAFTIQLPTLRDRPDDIPEIARAMADRFGRQFGKPGISLSDEAMDALCSHGWPGNIRELINVVQRAVMLSDSSVVNIGDLGLAARKPDAPSGTPSPGATNGRLHFDFKRGTYTADEVEKELIKQALTEVGGNISKAARLIGMNRSSLRYRIERSGLEGFIEELAGK